jgi:hypothetical protein
MNKDVLAAFATGELSNVNRRESNSLANSHTIDFFLSLYCHSLPIISFRRNAL